MSKRFFPYITLTSLLALTVALVSQHFFGLRPCAWCVLQRLLLLIIAGIGIVGWIASLIGIKVIQTLARILLFLGSAAGVAAAWYQHTVAAKLFSCDMTFADQFMIQTGLESAYPSIFGIYASCMDASVSVFGIDYALWALFFFTLLALTSLFSLIKN